jgi:SAM-dependent MidA family methyltransferase
VTVASDGSLVEVLVPLDSARAAWCDERAAGGARVGSRLPVQADAAHWLQRSLDLVPRGMVAIIDYAATSAELVGRPMDHWLRTYANHGRAGGPLMDPGSCDITCDVAVDQLALVRQPDADLSQREFLTMHGLDDLVAQGRARWEAEGFGGGLGALAARSRAIEAEALVDPEGLGAFRVLLWQNP